MKTALITGGTDGIGAATAISLAKRGYQLYITGRNEARAKAQLAKLNEANPNARHKYYLFDLSSTSSIKSFIEQFKSEHNQLEFLILNANSASKNIRLTDDGVEANFVVGYLSRYMLAIGLKELLERSSGHIIHVGIAAQVRRFNFEKIYQTNYGMMGATAQAYAADTLFAYHAGKESNSTVKHFMYDPAVVNTVQLKQQNWLLRYLGKWFSMEPEKAGETFANHLENIDPNWQSGSNFKLGKPAKVSKAAINHKDDYKKLMALSQELTGLKLNP